MSNCGMGSDEASELKRCSFPPRSKTFTRDCIDKKRIRNIGQLPMYYIQGHHEAIVSRDTYNAVQAELARWNAGHTPSKKSAPTGRTCYSSKYALTERLICDECGTLYRRCVWSKHGRKRIVWRCVSRLDYGTKYCKHSPTLSEDSLHTAILAAINSVMSDKDTLICQITDAMRMELSPAPGESMSIADIDRRIAAL